MMTTASRVGYGRTRTTTSNKVRIYSNSAGAIKLQLPNRSLPLNYSAMARIVDAQRETLSSLQLL